MLAQRMRRRRRKAYVGYGPVRPVEEGERSRKIRCQETAARSCGRGGESHRTV
jgi:hypothetical protein